jgi:Na+/H+-dicarboxylate symporter
VLNVVGDLVCATFVARSEKELRFPAASPQAIAAEA